MNYMHICNKHFAFDSREQTMRSSNASRAGGNGKRGKQLPGL